MAQGNDTKTTALVLAAICTMLTVVQYALGITLADVAICRDCTILARLAYSFFHASLLHAMLNSWCLLSIAFTYDVPIAYILLAYVIAVTYPAGSFSFCCASAAEPTVGLSAVCFALLGMVSFQTRNKPLYHSVVLSYIALGFILPPICSACGCDIAAPNNILHLYCYAIGLIVGYLNSPVCR